MAAELTIGELPPFSGTLSGNYLLEIEVPATSSVDASGYSITYSALIQTESIDDLANLPTSSISLSDKFILRDVSDTTDGASGTDKWIYFSSVSGASGSSSSATQPFTDSTALIKNSSDATKLLYFALSGIPTGSSITLTAPSANINLGEVNYFVSIVGGTSGVQLADDSTGRYLAIRILDKCTLVSAFMATRTLIASDANYYVFDVRKISSSGLTGSGTSMCSVSANSKATGVGSTSQFTSIENKEINIPVDQNLDLEVGDLVYFIFQPFGAPNGLSGRSQTLRLLAVRRV